MKQTNIMQEDVTDFISDILATLILMAIFAAIDGTLIWAIVNDAFTELKLSWYQCFATCICILSILGSSKRCFGK